jgi:ornithine cyclodeaminase
VSAAGIKLLSPPSISTLGIIGTGIQGLWQALFACSVREIKEIRAFDQAEENLRHFAEMIKAGCPDARFISCRSSEEVCLHSEVIITATNSPRPVIPDERDLFTGKTFIAIGSYKPDCREFPEQLFRQLDQLFVDTPDGMHESGDLIDPVKNKWLNEKMINPIGDLISGRISASSNPTRLFKTVGSAIFDLFAAKLIYENHINRQL